MRDARIVHEHVEAAKLIPDALRRGTNGSLIRDVELEGVGIRSDALRGRLTIFELARPDEHGEAARREILRDLKTDSFVGPGDQGDGFILHRNLLFRIAVRSTPSAQLFYRRESSFDCCS